MGRGVCSDEPFLLETDLGSHYRSGPYDALVTLPGGREGLAAVRHGFEMATTLAPNLNLLAILGWLGEALIVLQDLIRSRARLFS